MGVTAPPAMAADGRANGHNGEVSIEPQKPKPGGLAFLIPVAIWIVSSIVAIVFVVMGVANSNSVIEDFARIDDGTTATVELKSAGGYRVWLERPGVDDSFLDPTADVTVTRDGDPITVERYVGSLSYSGDGRDGEAIYTFNAPEAGEYEITGVVTDGEGGTFAVGKGNPPGEIARGFLLMFAIGTLGFLVALVILIVLFVKRGRSKRSIRQAAAGAYPQQGYGPPGYPPAGSAPPGYPQAAPGAPPAPGYGTPPAPGGPPVFGTPPPAQGSSPPPPPSAPFGGGSPPPPT